MFGGNLQYAMLGQEVLARMHRDLANRCPYSYQEILMAVFEPAILAAYINRYRFLQQPHGRDELLLWVNCMVAPKQVHDLSKSWANGEMLKALVNAISERRGSESFPVGSRDDVCKDAIDSGERLLGVLTRNFTAHELALGNVDEFRMRQYLSDYRDAFMKKNQTTVGSARGGIEAAMEERGIGLSEDELAALPPNDEVAKNSALISAAAEKYAFDFPSNQNTLLNLDTDIHVATAFLYKIKSAPERKVPTPVSRASSQPEPVAYPAPIRDVESNSPPVENTKLIKPRDSKMSTRRRIQYCIIAIVIIAILLIIGILVGTFVGLIVGVWDV